MRTVTSALAGLVLLGTAGSANAAISISATPGVASYAGSFTYDFETAAPITGGAIRTGSHSGLAAQPLGSTGNYWTLGPSDGATGVMNLASFAGISSIGFVWGSVDDYNWVDVLARNGTVLRTFNGVDVALAPNGDWVDTAMNPYVTISISGADRGNIGGLRFRSTTNAFELDNFAIAAVPEPSVWAMLILGFGVLGGAMRRRTATMVSSRGLVFAR